MFSVLNTMSTFASILSKEDVNVCRLEPSLGITYVLVALVTFTLLPIAAVMVTVETSPALRTLITIATIFAVMWLGDTFTVKANT